MARLSFIEKYKYLEQVFRMKRSGTRSGSRVYDGLLHELGHLVCLGKTSEVFLVRRNEARAKPWQQQWSVEDFVSESIAAYRLDGGNSDRDECRTIAACVHALRSKGLMRDTGKFVRSSLKAASDLCDEPGKMPTQVEKDLRTKASKKRGEQILRMVEDLYEAFQGAI